MCNTCFGMKQEDWIQIRSEMLTRGWYRKEIIGNLERNKKQTFVAVDLIVPAYFDRYTDNVCFCKIIPLPSNQYLDKIWCFHVQSDRKKWNRCSLFRTSNTKDTFNRMLTTNERRTVTALSGCFLVHGTFTNRASIVMIRPLEATQKNVSIDRK